MTVSMCRGCASSAKVRVSTKGQRKRRRSSKVTEPRRAKQRSSWGRGRSRLTSSDAKEDIMLQHGDDGVDAFTLAAIGEEHGPVAAYLSRLVEHEIEIHADVRREVRLVDDEQVASDHSGAAL